MAKIMSNVCRLRFLPHGDERGRACEEDEEHARSGDLGDGEHGRSRAALLFAFGGGGLRRAAALRSSG